MAEITTFCDNQCIDHNHHGSRTGSTPKINKPFLYFYVEPYGSTVHRCGLIDIDGKYTETGYKDATYSFGTISRVLPNEVRKEIVTIDL